MQPITPGASALLLVVLRLSLLVPSSGSGATTPPPIPPIPPIPPPTPPPPPANYTADVHIPLGGGALAAALKANAFLSTRMANAIDLAAVDKAHVTLYLTEFAAGTREPLFTALNDALYGIPPPLCNLSVAAPPFAAGNYAMLNVTSTPQSSKRKHSELDE